METCTKCPPTVKAHPWKKPTEKKTHSCYKWNVATIKIQVREKILQRVHLWFICVTVCVCLCVTLCRHFPHRAALLTHVPVCRLHQLSRGMDGFLLNVVSHLSFSVPKRASLWLLTSLEKSSMGKRHSWRSSVAKRSWISPEVKYH